MKVLVFLALAALAAAEAEPEADPQLLLNAGFPMAPWSPIVSVKSEEMKPTTYTVPSAYPYSGLIPYSGVPFTGFPWMYNGFPYPVAAVAKAEEAAPATEAARKKREAEPEADPQFLMNPLTYFPTVSGVPAVSPVTYSAGAWPATWSGALPSTWTDAWPAGWSHPGLPIAYTLAKKNE